MSGDRAPALLGAYFRRDLSAFRAELGAQSLVNETDSDGWTALFYASRDGENQFVKELLDHGADVNATDRDLRTPLHLAAQEYQIETARLLLQNGAHVDAQDVHGNTPLWRAAFESRGRPEMIRLLMAKGADISIKNKHGVSPTDLAESISNFDVKTPLGLS